MLYPPHVYYTFVRRIPLASRLILDVLQMDTGEYFAEFIARRGDNGYELLERICEGAETPEDAARLALSALNDLGYAVQA